MSQHCVTGTLLSKSLEGGKRDLYSVRENCCKPAAVPHDVTFPHEKKKVFCYENCSELLREKIVLVNEKQTFKIQV